jgi:hypothetical protein
MASAQKFQPHILVVLPLLFAGGCQLARMQLDPALADVPSQPVTGNSGRMWDRHLRFGAWQTSSVKEGWTRDLRREVGTSNGQAAALDKLSKHYHFDMSTASGPIGANCAQLGEVASHITSSGNVESTTEVDVAALRRIPPLQCTYDGVGGGSLKLLEQFRSAPVHDGEVEFAGEHWTVTEVHQVEGARAHTRAPMSGFEIRRAAIVVASVEVINGGRVWITPSLSQLDQDRAAAVITTLLLFSPLEVTRT